MTDSFAAAFAQVRVGRAVRIELPVKHPIMRGKSTNESKKRKGDQKAARMGDAGRFNPTDHGISRSGEGIIRPNRAQGDDPEVRGESCGGFRRDLEYFSDGHFGPSGRRRCPARSLAIHNRRRSRESPSGGFRTPFVAVSPSVDLIDR